MKIIYGGAHNTRPKFEDVLDNQFFVHFDCLYQKVDEGSANQITEEFGAPCAVSRIQFGSAESVDKIIPTIARIEYDD